MGFLQEKHGVMMLGRVPEGTCPLCAVSHDPGQPHNRDSLAYQYKFYDQYGRWPTWADAMEHCDQATKDAWTAALEEMMESEKRRKNDGNYAAKRHMDRRLEQNHEDHHDRREKRGRDCERCVQ